MLMKRILIYLVALTLLPQFVSAAVLVGKTEGAFSVSPTGAATYTIPIKVQNGLSDFSPSISLTYSSLSGNGIAGMGFSISGLSAISIVPRSVYFDGQAEAIYTGEDNAFALDGQRLLLKEGQNGQIGATYRTENEQYNLISITDSLNGTPATFQVKATNGTTYRYGSTTGRHTLSNGEAYQWALDYAEDVLGNYIQYNYSQEGVLYPTSISYGRNTHGTAGVDCTVSFTYESRPDSVPVYMHGEQHYLKKRLKSIVCKYNGNTYRTYTLNYTEDIFSHLSSVTETGTSSATLPPTTFEWDVPELNLLDYDCQMEKEDEYYDNKHYFAGDLDGDGISELISMKSIKIGPDYDYRPFIEFTGRKWNPESQKFEYCYCEETQSGISIPDMFTTWVHGGLLMHVNHGKANSLVLPFCRKDDIKAMIFNFVKEKRSLSIPLEGMSDEMPLYIILDADKNGLDDVFVVEKEKHNGTYPAYLVSCNLSTETLSSTTFSLNLQGDPDNIRCADFNSDGMVDLLITTSDGYYIYWNRSGSYSDDDRYFSDEFNVCDIIELGDFDGDGLVDLVINKHNSTKWYIARNTGNESDGYFILKKIDYLDQAGAGHVTQDYTHKENTYCIIQDLNGDGRSDAIVGYALGSGIDSHIYMRTLISDGKTLTYSDIFPTRIDFTFLEWAPSKYQIVLGNFEGNKGPEILYNDKLALFSTQWRWLRNSTIKPSSRKIVSITDGLGATDSISYGLLTDKDVYSVTTHHAFPLLPMAGALPVVKTRTESIPTDSRTTNYTYANGFTHLQGKGFLGFEDMRTESSLGIVTETHCKLDSTFYVLTSNTFSERNIHGEEMSRGGHSIRMERVSSSGTGARSYKTADTGSYKTDSFNQFSSHESSDDFDNGFPLYQSSNDGLVEVDKEITYWESPLIKGLPQEIETTKMAIYAVEGDDIYENITYERDPSTGLVLKETRSRNGLPVSTDGYSYNEYGQVTQHYTVAYESTDTLVTRYEYNEKGQLKKEYDPKGLYRSYNYNSTYGALTSVRDFDGVTTQYTYDGFLREKARKTTIETCQTTRALSNYGGGVYSIKESVTGKTPVTTYYDAWERKVAESAPLANGTVMYTDYHYLPNGQLGFVSFPHKMNEPSSEGTTYTYDASLRKTSAVDSNGKSSTWSYVTSGVVSCIDGVQKITYYWAPDLVQCVTDSLTRDWRGYETVAGGVVDYYYNVDENISSIDVYHTDLGPDCEDHTASYEYDEYGRLVKTTDVNGVTKEYSYDVNGQPYRTTIAGSYVETNYDKYGILRSKSWADSGESPHVVTYTYDNKFRLTKEEGEGYSNTFKYDSYSRITNKINNVLNNTTKYVTTNYGYNSDNQLSYVTMSIGKSYVTIAEHLSYKNGCQVSDTLNNKLVWSLTEQDRWGHVIKEKDRLGTTTHTYDDYGNMLSVNRVGSHPISESYTHDVHTGNLTNKNGTPLAYDDQNRLTGWGDFSYNYDRKGNITNQPLVGEFSYNEYRVEDINVDGNYNIDDSLRITYYKAIERPKSIENEHYKADFFYDGNGARYMMKVYKKQSGQFQPYLTRYYFNANTELTEDSCGNETYMYYAGGDAYTAPAVIVKNYGAIAATSIYQITRDNLGSVLLYENEEGAYYEFSYSPWGARTRIGDETNFYLPGEGIYGPFYRTYTGHEDLWMFGLLNANARLYSPYLGRFVSPDPLLNSEGSAWNYNPYVYANNNPYKYIDRNGEIGFVAALIIGFAAGGAMNVACNWDDIHNVGDFCSYFGVGCVAGTIGAAVAVAAPAGVFPGVIYGAMGGSLSGALLGGCNNLLKGLDFWSGASSGAWSGAASGALLGGLMGAAKANAEGLKGLDYWAGRERVTTIINPPAANASATPQNSGPKYLKPGETLKSSDWPADRVPGTTSMETFNKGTVIDRYSPTYKGLMNGEYYSSPGVSAENRAIPYDLKNAAYIKLELKCSLDVERSIVAPFPKFRLPGGGVQYQFINPDNPLKNMTPNYMLSKDYVRIIELKVPF